MSGNLVEDFDVVERAARSEPGAPRRLPCAGRGSVWAAVGVGALVLALALAITAIAVAATSGGCSAPPPLLVPLPAAECADAAAGFVSFAASFASAQDGYPLEATVQLTAAVMQPFATALALCGTLTVTRLAPQPAFSAAGAAAVASQQQFLLAGPPGVVGGQAGDNLLLLADGPPFSAAGLFFVSADGTQQARLSYQSGSGARPAPGAVLRVAGSCAPWLVAGGLAAMALQPAAPPAASECRGSFGTFGLGLRGTVPDYAADGTGLLVGVPRQGSQWQAICGRLDVTGFRPNPNITLSPLTFSAVGRFALRPPRPEADGLDNWFYSDAPFLSGRGIFFETSDRLANVRQQGDGQQALTMAKKGPLGTADGPSIVGSFTNATLQPSQ